MPDLGPTCLIHDDRPILEGAIYCPECLQEQREWRAADDFWDERDRQDAEAFGITTDELRIRRSQRRDL